MGFEETPTALLIDSLYRVKGLLDNALWPLWLCGTLVASAQGSAWAQTGAGHPATIHFQNHMHIICIYQVPHAGALLLESTVEWKQHFAKRYRPYG